MIERIDEIRKDIQEYLNGGYRLEDLKPLDKEDVDGFIWGIFEAENSIDSFIVDCDDTVIGKIKKEVAEELKEHLYRSMISSACELVYSHLDSD